MKQQIYICYFYYLFFSILLINNLTISAKLPSSFKVCHRGDSNFKQCLKDNVADALKQLTKSFPSIGLNSIDPYNIKEILVQPGSKGTVNFEQHYEDVSYHGISKTKIDSVDMDFDKKKLSIKGVVPEIEFKGKYKYNGKLLMVELKGNGKCSIKATDMKVTIDMDLEEFDKGGKKHFKVNAVKTVLAPATIHFDMENLFEGNKQLSDNLNQVLNENSKAVYEDVHDGYEGLFSNIVKSQTNSLFNHVPIDEIFPK